jgi:hypothetical protein
VSAAEGGDGPVDVGLVVEHVERDARAPVAAGCRDAGGLQDARGRLRAVDPGDDRRRDVRSLQLQRATKAGRETRGVRVDGRDVGLRECRSAGSAPTNACQAGETSKRRAQAASSASPP